METKITKEEIAELKAKASAERDVHQGILKDLQHVTSHCMVLSIERQMEIVKRGKEDEIDALLDVHKGSTHEDPNDPFSYRSLPPVICTEAQLYIQNNCSQRLKQKMYASIKLQQPIEKVLADEMIENSFLSFHSPTPPVQKFSPEIEEYLVKGILAKVKETDSAQPLTTLNAYIDKYDLSEKGEIALMSFLDISYGRESVIDKCRQMIKDYILLNRELCLNAQRILIASGDHELIMLYITTSTKGLITVDELLERANREEVEAYFARYITL